MKTNMFVKAEEIAEDFGVSKPFAYKLIKSLNEELNKKGFITVAGRVSRQYYQESCYGIQNTN